MKHVKLVLKACGQHYGLTAGPCAKCRRNDELRANPRCVAGLQYSGTPWIAVLGEPPEQPYRPRLV